MPVRRPRRWQVLAAALVLSAAAHRALGAPAADEASGKIASSLRHAARGGGAATGMDAAVDDRGRVQVRVTLVRIDPSVLGALAQAGMEVEIHNRALRAARGWIDPARLAELAALDVVVRITAPDYRHANAGSVQGEHDAALGCNEARSRFGIDGSGVRIGVISDGIDNVEGSTASGDAPAVVVPADPRCHAGDGDEGSAMIELIHDCAPGAEIAFCGPLDDLEMIECVECLSEVFGADVVVDDLGFLQQPFFEDGSIARAVDAAAMGGVAYFSSAGNHADDHYQARYVRCSGGSPRQDFGGGDCTLDFSFRRAVAVIMQWDEPFGAASSDYDLCVLGETCSSDPQNGDDDPIEVVAVGCEQPSGCSRQIEINRFSGEDRTLELYFIGLPGAGIAIEHNVPEDSIFGHACAANAIAVGAIDVSDQGNDEIEPFSSRGPCTIGSPAPVTRPKPEVVGLDGISHTGAGGFPSPFFGTSASAPGVAAVGALLLARDPTLGAAGLRAMLATSAFDLGAPGFDSVFGSGRVDALAAVAAITPRATPTETRTATRTGTPTRTPTPGPCFGDCNEDGKIALSELVTAVRIALGAAAMEVCVAVDSNRDGSVAIDEVVRAVNASVFRCAG